jgi:ribA/ribD-fused uncharacterized protein
MQIDYLNEYLEYNDSDIELEFCLRINAEWNEESYNKLFNILMSFFEICKKENEIPKEFDYFFTNTINRIIGILSNPIFTQNNLIDLNNEDYKNLILNKINELKKIRIIYEKRLFLKYYFFYGYNNPLSQWYNSTFVIDDLNFNSAEQWMMYSKAKLFNDYEKMNEIIKEPNQSRQRKLGRQVNGFKEDIWIKKREEIVRIGNLKKFTQNKELNFLLKETKKMILAETSPVDLIWGIGFSTNDLERFDNSKWRGLNLLGNILMEIREII